MGVPAIGWARRSVNPQFHIIRSASEVMPATRSTRAITQQGDNTMKRNTETATMKRSALAASLTASLCLGFAGPLLAAESSQTAAAHKPSPDAKVASHKQPAQKCLSDLRALDNQMQKDGFWLHGSGYGYGYPMYGYDYGDRGMMSPGAAGISHQPGTTYWRARPGFEVRTLIAATN